MITLSYSQAASFVAILVILVMLLAWLRLNNQTLRRNNKAIRQMLLKAPGVDWKAMLRAELEQERAAQATTEEAS